MPAAWKYVVDMSAGAALLFALLLVFIVDRVLKPSSAPAVNTLEVKVFEEGRLSAGTKRLKLAVTPTDRFEATKTKPVELWDDMGKLLTALGEGYKYDEIKVQDIVLNPKKLSQYDVLFLTCGRGGEDLREVLPKFVNNGGIVYASDWRYEAIAAAFPDMVEQTLQAKGAVQDVEAEVVDRDLSEIVGKKVNLKFNLPEWKTAAFAGPRVKTLIKGKYRKYVPPGERTEARYAEAPLMVKFTFGKGTVIFTSFHNEKQNSDVETRLLQYLVFSLVTARIDADVNSKLFEEGFTPQRSNLLSTPENNPSITKEYKHAQAGTLRFTLGFRNEGAKLKINLKSPDGKQFTHDAEYTVSLEVPNAAAGVWTYTVTATHLPYPNFPFTVTVGEKN